MGHPAGEMSSVKPARRRRYSLELGFLREGQGEREFGAVVEFAVGTNYSRMGEHDMFGDGEAKTGASRFAGTRFVDTIEALE